MTEPEFLELRHVLALHTRALAIYGGSEGIRDRGLLESAIAMPQMSFDGEYLHADLYEMAAAYAFHIAENQPFIDGNKRTAILAALTFLDMNGIPVFTATDALYDAMMAVAERRLDKTGLAAVLHQLYCPTEP